MTSVVSAKILADGAGILSQRAKADQRLKNVASVYQHVNRILTGKPIKVKIASEGSAPAWSTGDEIYFNASHITDIDLHTVERLHGLNAHERAHCEYTPRQFTPLSQWVTKNKYMSAFNALEDQRIESFMTAEYPSTAAWLTTTIARWILAEPQAKDFAYLLVRGRRYLPVQVRAVLRKSFVRPDLLPEIDRIVDTYRTLILPDEDDTARPLIEQFHDIMQEVLPTGKGDDGGSGKGKGEGDGDGEGWTVTDPCGHPTDKTTCGTGGRPKTKKEQKEAREKDAEADHEDDEDFDLDEFIENQSKGDSNGNTPTGDDRADSDDDGEEAPETNAEAGGDGVGIGTTDFDAVVAIMEDAIADVLDQSDIQDIIKQTQQQIIFGEAADFLNQDSYSVLSVSAEGQNAARAFMRALSKLRQDADPGWHRRTNTGRLNVVRYVRENNLDDSFDRWHQGYGDATDIEAVILLDVSGSMNNVRAQASETMWVTKRALDSINASTTVITYDNESRILYSRTDRADLGSYRMSGHSGGTQPQEGLDQAARIFASSRRSLKILVSISDGDWPISNDYYDYTLNRYDKRESCDELVQRMTDAGVVTAFALITDRPGAVNAHCHSVSTSVKSLDQLQVFAQNIVTSSIRRRLAHR
jgi:hypothetical protein